MKLHSAHTRDSKALLCESPISSELADFLSGISLGGQKLGEDRLIILERNSDGVFRADMDIWTLGPPILVAVSSRFAAFRARFPLAQPRPQTMRMPDGNRGDVLRL